MTATGFLEREVKLSAGPDLALGRLDGEPLERRQFSSVYYDSEDALLASVGITFRRRTEHGGSLWQLKLPRSEGRLELEEAGGPVAPPERFVTLLAAVLRERTLAPVAQLRTVRRGVRMRANGSTAEVVLDEVAVMDNLRVVSTFGEVEIELVDGEPDGLDEIEDAVRSAGAEDGDPRPKVLRVLGHTRPAKPSRPQLQAFFLRQYEQMLAHDPGTRLGDDPEDLHDLRVAVRRLRAILKVAAPPLDGAWADDLRAELDWLGSALGEVRDLDVMLDQLREDRSTLGADERRAFAPILRRLQRQRTARRRSLLAAMESHRYTNLLDRLEDAARRPRRDPRARRRRRSPRRSSRSFGRQDASSAASRATKPCTASGSKASVPATRPRSPPRAPARRSRSSSTPPRSSRTLPASTRTPSSRLSASVLSARADPKTAFAAGRIAERQDARSDSGPSGLSGAWEQLQRAGKRAW